MTPEPQHLLVVEDERVINDAVADRLRAEGFRVSQAYDGPGAVEQCAAERPDLVVLDVMLPGLRRPRGVPPDPGGAPRSRC